jgi:hypothetical protein
MSVDSVLCVMKQIEQPVFFVVQVKNDSGLCVLTIYIYV